MELFPGAWHRHVPLSGMSYHSRKSYCCKQNYGEAEVRSQNSEVRREEAEGKGIAICDVG